MAITVATTLVVIIAIEMHMGVLAVLLMGKTQKTDERIATEVLA